MKKISFTRHILPHAVAIAIFLLTTVLFFKPVFFDNKVLQQHDIQQFMGSAKSIVDHRNQTGEEALWANAMFSGMPAYLINVEWGNIVIGYMKRILSVGLPHPISNFYLAFISYYILLLAFGVRPYLAIGGAIAFGLSTYMVVGLSAGHNGRVGAIAFMPLVMAGIHLAFTNRKILGFGVATSGLALHLRENHLQITYYLALIVVVYGLIRFIEAVREKTLADFTKTIGLLILAAIIGAGTYFGPFWAIAEYTPYSLRGTNELAKPGADNQEGLSKEYAFRYNYGVLEPMTLLIPEFYGGSSAKFFAEDQKSASYQSLANSGNNQLANQLLNYTSAYWGPQSFTSAPYYAGAIIVFLFALGIAFANKQYIWWLVPLSILSLMLSWGDSFKAFNYFMFDYFPGYNKFRSVNFALIIILFAMPLLGFVGLENVLQKGIDKSAKKKLLIAFGTTGGLCLLLIVFAGMFGFTKETEAQLPAWFLNALAEDRKGLLQADAFRSLTFIAAIFILLYFNVHKKISPVGFYAFLILMITVDLAVVNKRYLTDENFKRKRDNSYFTPTESDQQILADKSYYRVYNLNPRNPYDAFMEARTSYFHNSIGGYHGAKIRRYQDFYDSCLIVQHFDFLRQAQQGKMDFSTYPAFNMLNVKYIIIGPESGNVIVNTGANGSAWYVSNIVKVNSPAEELKNTCSVSKTTAVIDVSRFPVSLSGSDSTATIEIVEHKPNYLKYRSKSQSPGLVVFSEIYYPGWKATIDGNEARVIRANYILRALEVPAGDHTIEFKFEPKPYTVGNKITTASSWLVLLVLLGTIGWSLKKAFED